jgi:acetylornithine deacetylase/succinyl-diaminopimelate desuccinylase-like protein
MRARGLFSLLILAPAVLAQGDRAVTYLKDLVRLDTTNPPGNETRVAEYLKRAVEAEGIGAELLGDNPSRLSFVARLRGSGAGRPLLLMAHSDVVPADPAQWTAPPFGALTRDGQIWGRGTVDDKNLLAAELAVLVELKRRGVKLRRDVILLSEADEEAGSTGIEWLIRNAWAKIDAEFALNETGAWYHTPSGTRIYEIQTAEKIPTRVIMTAHGTAGHGSLPRPDNPVVHLARAVTRLAEAEQPVRLNATTRRYFHTLAELPDYAWLKPLLPGLETEPEAGLIAAKIRARDPELDAMLRTSVSPTILQGGAKINVIPNAATAQVDVRRLPNESREEVLDRFRRTVNDPAVEIVHAPGQQMPATEPSSMTTALYRAMERVFGPSPAKATVVPVQSRGATDGAYLRAKGMAVYGAPVFARETGGSRAHANDERIAVDNLRNGAELLWKVVLAVAGAGADSSAQ